MSEATNLKMEKLAAPKKEEDDEHVFDREGFKILEEEDMLQKNVRRIKDC